MFNHHYFKAISQSHEFFRFFDWKTSKDTEKPLLEIKSSERILSQLENAGLQLTLAFDSLGSLLAAGGEVENPYSIFCSSYLK